VVKQAPEHGTAEHLPQSLRGLEAVAVGDRHPPGRDLLRTQLVQRTVAERRGGLAEQPPQFGQCARRDLVLHQVHRDQLGKRRDEGEVRGETRQFCIQRLARVQLRGEPAALHST
jgi:hypothetical protein